MSCTHYVSAPHNFQLHRVEVGFFSLTFIRFSFLHSQFKGRFSTSTNHTVFFVKLVRHNQWAHDVVYIWLRPENTNLTLIICLLLQYCDHCGRFPFHIWPQTVTVFLPRSQFYLQRFTFSPRNSGVKYSTFQPLLLTVCLSSTKI